jgi:hypothetical protein
MDKTWRMSAAPAVRCKVKGGRKVVAVYERAHMAWRAGVIDDFYLGTRSETDETVVWRLEGVELERAKLEQVENLLARAELRAGVESLEWGPYWCGFRELVVSFVDGSSVCQAYNGREVVEYLTPANGRRAELVAVAS